MGRIEDWLSINIAQQRSSDSILIVHGTQFNLQTNHPGNKEWFLNHRTFGYCDYKEVVNHIMGLLNERWAGEWVKIVNGEKKPKKSKKAKKVEKLETAINNSDTESKDKFDKSELAELMG